MSLETPIKIRMLQRKLYQKAKEEPSYRFYLLYDKMYREDVLAHAYALVRSNQGAPGVDGQSFWGIESKGLEEWLSGIREDLRSKTYRPQAVRRVMIPKPGGGERPFTGRDPSLLRRAKCQQAGGNFFRLSDAKHADHVPCSLAGLYAIFTPEAVVYFGEASDLCRRQLKDPDNTADSGKVFTNQERAVLKLLLHRGWAECLSLVPLFIQLYPADCRLYTREGQTFEECYRVSRFSKALEGALSLSVPRFHQGMLTRAVSDHLFAVHK